MSALTKAQLAAENAALRTEIDTLRLQLQRVTSVASAVNSMRVSPQLAQERAKAMAAARELAVKQRKCVLVRTA